MRDPIQPVFRERVQADWIDYNGHLNEAFYLLIFSHATDELIDRIGMDAGYREREKRSIYTLETHILYALEVKQGVEVEVRTRLLDLDGKRIHLFHEMVRPDGGIACVSEMVMACVDMTGPRVCAFAAGPMERLEALFERDRVLPWPEKAGRAVGLRKGRRQDIS